MKLTIPAPTDAPRPAPIPDRLPWRDGAIVGAAVAVMVGVVGGVLSVLIALAVQSLVVAAVGLLVTGGGATMAGVIVGGRLVVRWTADHVNLRLYPAPVSVVQQAAYEPPAQIKVTLERPNDGGYTSYQYRRYPGDMAILARELLAGRPFTVRAFRDILSEDRLQELRQLLIDDDLAAWKTGDVRQGCELTSNGWKVMAELSPTPPPPAETV